MFQVELDNHSSFSGITSTQEMIVDIFAMLVIVFSDLILRYRNSMFKLHENDKVIKYDLLNMF